MKNLVIIECRDCGCRIDFKVEVESYILRKIRDFIVECPNCDSEDTGLIYNGKAEI